MHASLKIIILHHEKWLFFNRLIENHFSGIDSVLEPSFLFSVCTLDT